jgi:serine/threonine protein kinase
VKIFKPSQSDAGIAGDDAARRAFEAEDTVLQDLSQFDHAHIVGRIAAMEYDGEYILLSRWADGGDLRKFWSSNPTPKLDAKLVQQTLVQLMGLASAIHTLHTNNNRMGPVTQTGEMMKALSVVPESPEVPHIVADDMPSQGGYTHFRHGDIKPENILVNGLEGSQIGILMIGDVGLAKRHLNPTVHRRQKTETKHATTSYGPPEAFATPLGPRSRLYDIWSYGCTMFEMIIWLLYGGQGLDGYWAIPVDKHQGTLFFTAPTGQPARVNDHTSSLMQSILAGDLAQSGPSGSALRDLLILIQTKVLVVDLPGRVDATSLLAEMNRIVTKASGAGGTAYLFPDMLKSSERRIIPIIVDSPRAGHAHLVVPAAAQRVRNLGISISSMDRADFPWNAQEVRQSHIKHESW